MTTTTEPTLGDLVTRQPGAARVLERHGLDYCCRGRRTLAEACDVAGIDPSLVLADLAALEADEPESWSELPPVELIQHLVATHHAYLQEELPLLDALAEKVERVHVERHPELATVRGLVAALQADLLPHMMKEERVLFPAIAAWYEGQREFPFGSIENPIRVMLAEHDRAGELLRKLRTVTDDYAVPDDACMSYRSLYARLATVESDTFLHVHKENNVLFPAVLEAIAD